MSEMVLTNAHLTLDSNDLSDHVRSIRLSYSAEQKDVAAMGDGTRSFLGGLKNWSAEIEFNQDFAASDLDSILFPLVGTAFTIAIRPDAGSKSTSNPEYGGDAMLADYNPLDGAVGDEATTTISLVPAKSSPTLTRSTS